MIDKLARELHLSQDEIREWISEYPGDKNSTRMVENYIRTRHLKETHPKVFRMLDNVSSSSLAYERWVCVLRKLIGSRKPEGE